MATVIPVHRIIRTQSGIDRASLASEKIVNAAICRNMWLALGRFNSPNGFDDAHGLAQCPF